jgi:rhamnosyltransferase
MHDWYLALVAASIGQLLYVDQPTVLYRQHDDNVLGARTLSKRMKNWFSHWFKKYWWLIKSSQAQAKKLLDFPELTSENRQLITAYINILNQSASERLATLRQYNLRKNKTFHTGIFRTLIVTKFAYKKEKL